MRPRHSPPHTKALQLQHCAAQNRGAPTASEARLWSALSAGKLGVSFRRQVVVGNFIVDFLAPRLSVTLTASVDLADFYERFGFRTFRDVAHVWCRQE